MNQKKKGGDAGTDMDFRVLAWQLLRIMWRREAFALVAATGCIQGCFWNLKNQPKEVRR